MLIKRLRGSSERCLLEPVGDGHHDIEGPQEEDKVEIGVAVDGCLPLVIHHVLARAGLLLVKLICETHIQKKVNFIGKLLFMGTCCATYSSDKH